MPISRWIIAVAFGLIATLGQAKEQTSKPGESAGQQQDPAQTPSFSIPIHVIEDQSSAQSRERAENEARDREIRDLAAQEGMNAATKSIERATWDMRNYALYSAILVGIGTVMLGITLWLTRQANKAAQAAVDVTREIGEAQVRAWLQIRLKAPSGLLASSESLPFGLLLDVTNIGNGPATNVLFDVWLYQSIGHHDENEIVGLRDKLIEQVETEHIRPSTILPGETQCRHRAEALPIDRSAVMPFLGGVCPAACVVAVYRTATDQEWHCTAAIFDIFIKDDSGSGLGYPFPLDGKEVIGERINIVMRRNAIGT